MSEIVGIDLGTTNSLVAKIIDGKPVVLRGPDGKSLVPSVICFPKQGPPLVGSEAKARSLSDPLHTVFSVKRLMGRTLAELRGELGFIPQRISERDAGEGRKVLCVDINGVQHTPEELSALILKEVKQRAGNPTRAVITVPAHFDESQRQATRDAGKIAGLEVLRIINEPTAAALAYGLDRRRKGTIAVYDFGGGTFDCTILNLQDGVFRVLSTGGDTRLGGDDIDRALIGLLLEKLGQGTKETDQQKDLDPLLLQTLRDLSERAKIALTDADRTVVEIPPCPWAPLGQTFPISRQEFEELILPLVKRSLDRCRIALRDAQKTPNQIDEVALVGGSTRIPLVRRLVGEFFGRKPHTELNPDEAVALGAAIQADILTGNRRQTLLLDVVPLSLGIVTLGGAVSKLIHRNTTIPARATERFTTAVDNQTAVEITVVQGERELAKDCRALGRFKLSGIPPMPSQMAQVDVTFLIDADGLLTVTACEKRSNQEARVSIKPAHGLSDDEVERLVLESVDHAHEDFRARRLIELKAKGAILISHTRRTLGRTELDIPSEERNQIESAVVLVTEASQTEDIQTPEPGDRLNAAINHLSEVTLPLATRVMDATALKVLSSRKPDQVTTELIS